MRSGGKRWHAVHENQWHPQKSPRVASRPQDSHSSGCLKDSNDGWSPHSGHWRLGSMSASRTRSIGSSPAAGRPGEPGVGKSDMRSRTMGADLVDTCGTADSCDVQDSSPEETLRTPAWNQCRLLRSRLADARVRLCSAAMRAASGRSPGQRKKRARRWRAPAVGPLRLVAG